MTVYRPARGHGVAAGVAAALASLCAWGGLHWPAAMVPAIVLAATAAVFCRLAALPAIEVSPTGLRTGSRWIAWKDVAAVEETAWKAPLVLRLVLRDGAARKLIYAGDAASSARLAECVRRLAAWARADDAGRPAPGCAAAVASRPRLLRREDEEEVERLYRRLRSVGRLDPYSEAEPDREG